MVASSPNGGMIIAVGILMVDDDLHAILILQIEKSLFHVADDNNYVINTRFFELVNKTLD